MAVKLGCEQIELTSGDSSGVKREWFDEQRLTDMPLATSGGPQTAPPATHP